jgi:hypothetical protein
MVGLSVNRHMEARSGLTRMRISERFDGARPQYHQAQ